MRLSEIQKINRRYRRKQAWRKLKSELVEFLQAFCVFMTYGVIVTCFMAAF